MITASGLIRFFHLASTALLLGSFVFSFIVSRPALASAGGLESSEFAAFDQRQQRFGRWSLLLVFLSGLLSFWLQIAAVSGLSFTASLNPTVMAGVLIGTRYGLVWSIRMALMLFLDVVFNRLERGESAKLRALGLLLAAALTVAPVFSGHAAAGEGVWLAVQLTIAAFHLGAASAWLGGWLFLRGSFFGLRASIKFGRVRRSRGPRVDFPRLAWFAFRFSLQPAHTTLGRWSARCRRWSGRVMDNYF